jgi:hypothetical protein
MPPQKNSRGELQGLATRWREIHLTTISANLGRIRDLLLKRGQNRGATQRRIRDLIVLCSFSNPCANGIPIACGQFFLSVRHAKLG